MCMHVYRFTCLRDCLHSSVYWHARALSCDGLYVYTRPYTYTVLHTHAYMYEDASCINHHLSFITYACMQAVYPLHPRRTPLWNVPPPQASVHSQWKATRPTLTYAHTRIPCLVTRHWLPMCCSRVEGWSLEVCTCAMKGRMLEQDYHHHQQHYHRHHRHHHHHFRRHRHLHLYYLDLPAVERGG